MFSSKFSFKENNIFQLVEQNVHAKGRGPEAIWFFSVLVSKINLLIYRFIILPQLIDWRFNNFEDQNTKIQQFNWRQKFNNLTKKALLLEKPLEKQLSRSVP